MQANPRPRRGVVVRAALGILVVVALIGAFYLVRTYTGFGGYPTLQTSDGNSGVFHASTVGTNQYTWVLEPQVVIHNGGDAAASNVVVYWSVSGGPLGQPTQGESDVGTILPGASQTVSWSFTSGLTTSPFPTYVVTATVESSQSPNIVTTVTLTPPASCVTAASSTPCQ